MITVPFHTWESNPAVLLQVSAVTKMHISRLLVFCPSPFCFYLLGDWPFFMIWVKCPFAKLAL